MLTGIVLGFADVALVVTALVFAHTFQVLVEAAMFGAAVSPTGRVVLVLVPVDDVKSVARRIQDAITVDADAALTVD